MSEKEIRIGVFVCHCGSNIGGLIDCKSLAEYAGNLPDVAYSEDTLYTCSETGLSGIKKAVEEHALNRVVVASCTPRTHEPLFRDTIKEAGLNPYLFNFVNIRDQCTWVHVKNPDEAFIKAKDLIRMGISKAKKLDALEDIQIQVTSSAIIIGGGIAGMSAALSLNNQGFKTYLIEKEEQLGGILNNIFKLFPHDQEASILLDDFKSRIESANNLQVLTSAKVKDIKGFVGNYEVQIEQKGNIISLNSGAIIVAVGASRFIPNHMYGHDGKVRLTQFELEKKLKEEKIEAKKVVMVQCVGSRNDQRPYCSSICCMSAIKNALILKEMNPDINITILFRDLYTPGIEYEKYYRKARENGIIFLRYSLEHELTVEEDHVLAFNEYLGITMKHPYDLLVLSTPLIANEDNKELAQLLKIPLEKNGFFLEAHVKLRPNDFATDGIYLCGNAKWPTDVKESITQGYASAARASTILSHDMIYVEGATANLPEWNKKLCKGCEVCIKVCPFNAIKKNEEDEIIIVKALCKGCGTCGATCTKQAITIQHFTNEQILSEIYALGGKEMR